MALYLLEIAYTPEAWASQIKNPQNRIDVVRPVLEKVGGRFVSVYFAFGDADLIAIIEAPNNAAAAAFALAVTAGGACRSYKTTPLMSVEEGTAAIKQAGEVAAADQPPRG